MEKNRRTLTYRVVSFFVPNLAHRFYKINPLQALLIFFKYYHDEILNKFARNSVIFGPFRAKIIRPIIHRKRGCKIGKDVFIGDFDPNHSSKIIIEDGVFLTARCMLLNHRRNTEIYSKGDWIGDNEHVIGKIHIKRGAHIGVGSIILPGVTIGEGTIIGAGSVVTKNIPPNSIAVGVPAKVIRTIS